MKSSSSNKKKPADNKDTVDSVSTPQRIKSENLFPVVGIGASAGGLDAFKKLLKAISEDSGMAYVLVQHLDPNHESMLPEILQKVTSIPVLEISDDIKVKPDHIYVIPSNKMMVATDGVLLLKPRPEKSTTGRNLPIDLFFTSLAEVHQEHAIGVVLSGTASDGTQGLKAIKEHGGITFAQDEASAEYEGMPHSAALAGVVDFILPPEEMPKKLLEVTSKIVRSDDELQNIPQQDEDVFKQILSLLRIRKGVDFTYYKQTTIRRRILRRMVVNKNEFPAEYLKFLRGNNPEQDLLYQDLLIPVTSFFRDKKAFENLTTQVYPSIIKNKIPGDITRIWVAGCSTGQEVYSIAISFREFLGDQQERVQIFGTDLSEPAIAKARTGVYEKSEMQVISPKRLEEFFTKSNGSYQVNKGIRDMCVFAHHNFLKDPPFGKMDMIACRNVLIYMEPYLQKKALTTFHYALKSTGFLMLGTSETTSGVTELFDSATKTNKLFTRKNVPGNFMQVTSQRSEQILSRTIENTKSEAIRTDFQKTADDILLTKYTPAGVVVNESLDIVHFRGNTGNYLEQSPGKPSHNLLVMAKYGLPFELRNILHKAKTKKIQVVKENIPLNINGDIRNISIEAIPLTNTLEPYYLILFHDKDLIDSDSPLTGPGAKSNKKKVSVKTKQDGKDIRIHQLEDDLSHARDDMRSITEEQEAANEELQSANEELLSSSEELQSLNEELETSKEELQSTNEELTVLNQELINLNDQITDARNYSQSIVATLYQPLLVMDKNLRVKTANKAFYVTFHVNELETEGVLVYDLGNRQWNIPELRTLLEEILPQKKQVNDFEVTHNFSNIGERVILLSALEIIREKNEEKLILLSIEDVTIKKHAQKKLEESQEQFSTLAENMENLAWLADGEGSIYWYNKRWYDYTGTTLEEMAGWGWQKVHHPDHVDRVVDFVKSAWYKNEPFELTFPLRNRDGEYKWFLTRAFPMADVDGNVIRWIGTNTNIDEQKKTEVEIKYQKALLEAHNEASIDGILLVDAKGKILSYNHKFIEIWNMPKHIVDTKDDEAALRFAMTQLVHPEQFIEKVKWLYAHPTEVISDELEFKDGKIVQRHGYPVVAEDGSYYAWSWTFRDITNQKIYEKNIKESEEHFRVMADTMPQKVWTADVEGNYHYFNKCWLDYTGHDFEDLKNWGWEKVVHPDDWEETKKRWLESIKTGENFEIEHRYLNTEGKYKWHLSRGLAQKDSYGVIKKWIGTNTEMHHIKEEEQRKSDFIKMVSHELKTPVTSIKGYVQILLTMLENEQPIQTSLPLKSSLTRIDSQVSRLTRLITEILDLSRIEAGKLELKNELFSLNNLVTETVGDIVHSNTKHPIHLSQDFTCDITGDRDRIGQVLINLINNAVKYSPENSNIEIRVQKAGKNRVAVSIEDQGIGIDKKDHQKIFERFYRVDGESEQTFAGFGIGLFIASEIIQRHNGFITIDSEKGKGSVFTVTLPLTT